MNKPLERAALQVRDIRHWIGGQEVAGTQRALRRRVRPGARARSSGRVAFASADEVGAAVAAAQAAFPAWAATPPLRRARVMFKFKELIERDLDTLAAPDLQRARQGRVRRARRGHARTGSRRVRLRHPAPAQRRVQRAGGHRRGQLLDAPAAGRMRRHHAVQLPGDGAACGCSRSRSPAATPSCSNLPSAIHPPAFTSRSCCRRPACRTACSTSCMATKSPWMRCCTIRACRGELRRLHTYRRVHLPHRHRHRQARAGPRRRQEPSGGDAGCRSGPGGRRAHRRSLWLGRRALHGHLGGRSGRRHRRRAGGTPGAAREGAEDQRRHDEAAEMGPLVTRAASG